MMFNYLWVAIFRKPENGLVAGHGPALVVLVDLVAAAGDNPR